MVTEIVLFGLPDGMTRDELLGNYRRSAPRWRENSELIGSTTSSTCSDAGAGGLPLDVDRDREARTRRGVAPPGRRALRPEPVIQCFETPLVVDNALGAIVDEG